MNSIWRRIVKIVFYIYIISGIVACLVLIGQGGYNTGIGLLGIAGVFISASGLGLFLEMADNIAQMEAYLLRISGNTESISEKVAQTADDSGQIKRAVFSIQNTKKE